MGPYNVDNKNKHLFYPPPVSGDTEYLTGQKVVSRAHRWKLEKMSLEASAHLVLVFTYE